MGGDSRRQQGFPPVSLRGFAGAGGSFRRPRAGCARDAVLSRLSTSSTSRYPVVVPGLRQYRDDEEERSGSGRSTAEPAHVDMRTTRTGTTRWVAPRSVRLSSPERVLFPDEGITKQDLFEYYRAIAPLLVPHLRNRPFTMKRSPYGVAGEAYFQKQAPKGMPSWIPTRTYRTYQREGGSRLVDFPLVNSPEALLWMVQMNCIDMNAWYSRVDKPDRPDFVLFDLDPPEGGFALAIRVAHLIREELERLELESHVKTSGADGIHVLVPIARRATFEQTYMFAERVARGLEERHPGLVTTEWLKHKREGVLVDHRQNARGKTIASVYSVRPKPGAPVSTPLRWDELTEDVTPRRFGMREAFERVEQYGDLFEPVLAGGQALGRAVRQLR
jgi:bifunctional non-homologous end joining protein LigD